MLKALWLYANLNGGTSRPFFTAAVRAFVRALSVLGKRRYGMVCWVLLGGVNKMLIKYECMHFYEHANAIRNYF